MSEPCKLTYEEMLKELTDSRTPEFLNRDETWEKIGLPHWEEMDNDGEKDENEL